MKKLRLILAVSLVGFIAPMTLLSQNVEEMLSKYTGKNGEKYMQPFADAFSANLNSGLFHNAKLKKNGFQIYLGMETQMAFIPSKAKFMTATTEGDYFPKTTVKGVPTIFGPTKGKMIESPTNGLVYAFPGGMDWGFVPMITPQLTIGSVYGTNLTFRYAGTDKVEDIGKISLFGWGIRHSVDQYFKLPINLAVGFYNQKFKVGQYMEASSSLISVQTSYSIPIITVFGGLGYEMGNMELGYEHEDKDTGDMEDVKFDLKPGNTVRLTMGIGFNLGPVNLHGEYNLAKQSTVSVGLGLGFGDK